MLLSVFRHWLPSVLLISFIACALYVTVQQIYRQGADDPQIQMAIDAARALEAGRTPAMVAPYEESIDISLSLAPFLAVFDERGRLLSSTGALHREDIRLSAGAFDYARAHGEHRFTWGPEPGVRQAVVLVRYERGGVKGFVLAARSLREVEERIATFTRNITLASFVAFLLSLILSFLIVWSRRYFPDRAGTRG